jgi:hypothetical protein
MGENSKIHLRGRPKEGRHPNFKTGKSKCKHGYIIVFVGKHHHLADCRGYAYEHRLVAEKKIGRQLKRSEYVHHKDERKDNNHPDNLEVYPSKAHHFLQHRTKNDWKKLPDEENKFIKCACGCGNELLQFDKSNRRRKFITGHNMRIRQFPV